MNKFISIFFLFFITSTTFGQQFSIQELISLSQNSFKNFDDKVTSKSYKVEEVIDRQDSETSKYVFEGNGSLPNLFYSISYMKNLDINVVDIIWKTRSKNDYLNAKNQTKIEGFKCFENKYFGGAYFLKYKKGNLEIELVSLSKGQNKNGESITEYLIEVTILNK